MPGTQCVYVWERKVVVVVVCIHEKSVTDILG